MARGTGAGCRGGASARGPRSSDQATIEQAKAAWELSRTVAELNYELGNIRYDLEYRGATDQGELAEAEAAYQAAKAELDALQAELGGAVYRIPCQNLDELEAKLAKLNKRAAKIGVEPVTLDKVGGEFVLSGNKEKAAAGIGQAWEWVVMAGKTPQVEGWEFLATLQPTEAGAIVRKTPRLGDEEIDLSAYYHADPTVCDHCHTSRRRADVYVVWNPETREMLQVGSSCLKDFIGANDPERIARYAEWLRDAVDFASEGDADGWELGGGRRPDISTVGFLAHAALMVRKHGWTPRSQADGTRPATADRATENLWNMISGLKDRTTGKQSWENPEPEDIAEAEAALAWTRAEFGPKVAAGTASDYERNLYLSLAGESMVKKGEGLAASAISAYHKATQRQADRAERDQTQERARTVSRHIGAEKERIERQVKVIEMFESSRQGYGYNADDEPLYIYTLEDTEGNQFKWFTGEKTLDVDPEVEITIAGTVKRHDTYKEVEQTILSRVRVTDDPRHPAPLKPTKVGQRVPAQAEVNGQQAEGEIEKLQSGFRVYVADEAVGETRTYKQALDQLGSAWHEISRDRERAEYLSTGLPAGATPKRGSYNPFTDYSGRGPSPSRYAQDGELVALRPKRDGDSAFSYPGAWVPARPPHDNANPELVFVPAQVSPSATEQGTTARATGPDGIEIPLGESDVIVRSDDATA